MKTQHSKVSQWHYTMWCYIIPVQVLGRESKKCNSGFLKVLNFSDVMVLADRGFDIGDDNALNGARLEIPAVTTQYAGKSNTQCLYSC